MVEAVLSGAEASAFDEAQQEEGVTAADDAGALELLAHGLGSGSAGEIDEGLGRRAGGGQDPESNDGCGDHERKQQEPEKSQRRTSSLTPGRPMRHRGLP